MLGAAAVALAVAAGLTGGSPGQRTGTHEPVRPLTARQVLLTAAEKAAAQPVGRYWHTHVISSEGYHIDRGDYMIFGARHEIDQWLARSDNDADVFRSRFRRRDAADRGRPRGLGEDGGADELDAAARVLGEVSRDDEALALRVPSDGGVASLRALLERLDSSAIASLSVHTPDLDDVFLALTGQSQKEKVR